MPFKNSISGTLHCWLAGLRRNAGLLWRTSAIQCTTLSGTTRSEFYMFVIHSKSHFLLAVPQIFFFVFSFFQYLYQRFKSVSSTYMSGDPITETNISFVPIYKIQLRHAISEQNWTHFVRRYFSGQSIFLKYCS